MRGPRIDRAFHRYCQTGDPQWLGRVFDATANDLFRLAWYLVGDRQAAEDLVQVTYLAAIESARDFEQGGEVMPWLCGILANRARDLRRQRVRRLAGPTEPRLDVVDPVSEVVAREVQSEVSKALLGLPTLYREVLTLHLEEGLAPQAPPADLMRIEVPRTRIPDAVLTGAVWRDDGQPATRGLIQLTRQYARSCMRIRLRSASRAQA